MWANNIKRKRGREELRERVTGEMGMALKYTFYKYRFTFFLNLGIRQSKPFLRTRPPPPYNFIPPLNIPHSSISH